MAENKKKAQYNESFDELDESKSRGSKSNQQKGIKDNPVLSEQAKKALTADPPKHISEKVVGANNSNLEKGAKEAFKTEPRITETKPTVEKTTAIYKKNDKTVSATTSKDATLPDFKGHIKPIKEISPQISSTKVSRIKQRIDKVSKGLDSLFSADYKNYKVNTNGKDSLKQFNNEELKYLNRDYKIANKDNSAIKSEMAERKLDTKAFNKSTAVEALYAIKTDKGEVSLGVDKNDGELMISKNYYKNNANIKTWEKLESGDLQKALISQGDIGNLEIKNNVDSINRPDISNDNLGKLQDEIRNGVSNSQANNHIKDLNSENLKNPTELVGQVIRTQENDSERLYKVLASDKDNMTIQPLSEGKDSNAYLINVATERNQAISQEVQVTGIIDDKTVIGHNHVTNETFMGTVNKDNDVNWQNKDDYFKEQSPEKRNEVAKQLETGDYRLANLTPVGKIEGGNILYAAEKANKDIVLTANQEDWVNAKDNVGKNLINMSGLTLDKVQSQVAENSRSPKSAEALEKSIMQNQGQNQSQGQSQQQQLEQQVKTVVKALSL